MVMPTMIQAPGAPGAPTTAVPPATVQVDAQQVASQNAAISARIRNLEQSIRPRAIVIQPPRRSDPIMSGKELTAISIFFTLAVLMPLTIGLVIRLIRRPTREVPAPSDPMMNARMERLEQAMDAIAIEIERISEGQRFVTKVLTERPAQTTPAAASGTIDASALGEPKPFRALGAGPMEPIRAPERQGVRASITPH
jgi:hypothetical protein